MFRFVRAADSFDLTPVLKTRFCAPSYCEQNDIHSPNITVHESLLFSARLRFSKDVEKDIVEAFVEEVRFTGLEY